MGTSMYHSLSMRVVTCVGGIHIGSSFNLLPFHLITTTARQLSVVCLCTCTCMYMYAYLVHPL